MLPQSPAYMVSARGFSRIDVMIRCLRAVFWLSWGPLFSHSPALQTSLREVLESLSFDKAAAAAFLHAVRTGTFPRKLVRQVRTSIAENVHVDAAVRVEICTLNLGYGSSASSSI